MEFSVLNCLKRKKKGLLKSSISWSFLWQKVDIISMFVLNAVPR